MASEREKTWEGRVWTVAQLFMSAAVLWGASTLWDLSKTVARIDERLSFAMANQTNLVVTQNARDQIQDINLEKIAKRIEELELRRYR